MTDMQEAVEAAVGSFYDVMHGRERVGGESEMAVSGLIEHRCLDVEGNRPDASLKQAHQVDSIIIIEPSDSRTVRYRSGQAALWAATFDGQWFADHPRERVRVRPYNRGEFGSRRSEERFFPLVVVVRVGYGQRLRVGFEERRQRGAS